MNLKNMSKHEFECMSRQLKTQLSSIGLEAHPFKIQWYNLMVSPKFRLPFDDNCIAFAIISTPDMFEMAFLPFLRSNLFDTNSTNDPIDECMKYHLNSIKLSFCEFAVEVIHDFELFMPNRRPKVLVQTAAHVSGAAFYYKSEAVESTDPSNRQLGVCIHPRYGGWFAIRGIVVFTHLTYESLEQRQPKDVIQTVDLKKKLLFKFNNEWRDWSYRDIIPVTKKYSDLQIKYFSLKPCDRKEFLNYLIDFKN